MLKIIAVSLVFVLRLCVHTATTPLQFEAKYTDLDSSESCISVTAYGGSCGSSGRQTFSCHVNLKGTCVQEYLYVCEGKEILRNSIIVQMIVHFRVLRIIKGQGADGM